MRIKDFICTGLLLFSVFAFSSCGEDSTIINNGWDSGSLSVSEEVLLDGSNTQQINIKASIRPTLSSDAEWLKVGEVKSISTGLYTTELKAEANTTGDDRIATVTVTAGKETATVKVTQTSSDVVQIKSVYPEGDLDPAGGTLTIKYAATGTPATNLPEWMSISATRTLTEGEMKIAYTPNTTGKEREGIIVLAVGEAVANITVTQP